VVELLLFMRLVQKNVKYCHKSKNRKNVFTVAENEVKYYTCYDVTIRKVRGAERGISFCMGLGVSPPFSKFIA